MSQSQENFQTERQKDGQTLIHRTPLAMAEDPIIMHDSSYAYIFLKIGETAPEISTERVFESF